MPTNITYFHDDTELVNSLSTRILELLSQGIEAKGHATLVVSGGSTPKRLFNYLSEQNFPWEKVTVTLADDRCVDTHAEDSNYNLLQSTLFQNLAAAAKFLPLYSNEENPEDAATNASELLNKTESYDVVILGMGTDGHTASLFPQASNLALALSNDSPDCIAIDPVTNNMMRVSQSLQRLLDSKKIIFHLIGKPKHDTLKEVLADKQKLLYPSSHIIHQKKVPVEIFYACEK